MRSRRRGAAATPRRYPTWMRNVRYYRDEQLVVGMVEHNAVRRWRSRAELARLRFGPTTSLGAGGVMPPSKDRTGNRPDAGSTAAAPESPALARANSASQRVPSRGRSAGRPAPWIRVRCRPPLNSPTPPLHPRLAQLSQDWEGDDDEFTPVLAFALSRSRPDSKAQALRVEHDLVWPESTPCWPAGCLTATTEHCVRQSAHAGSAHR
jgi:hypothetical protein